jgi:hypothetical protein
MKLFNWPLASAFIFSNFVLSYSDQGPKENSMAEIYCATFIFRKGEFTEEFHRLDAVIADYAKKTKGYLGEESYENNENGQIINLYYWNNLEGLKDLMQNGTHLNAKRQQAKWLKGYQVTISKILAAYNDQQISHPLKTTLLRPDFLSILPK